MGTSGVLRGEWSLTSRVPRFAAQVIGSFDAGCSENSVFIGVRMPVQKVSIRMEQIGSWHGGARAHSLEVRPTTMGPATIWGRLRP